MASLGHHLGSLGSRSDRDRAEKAAFSPPLSSHSQLSPNRSSPPRSPISNDEPKPCDTSSGSASSMDDRASTISSLSSSSKFDFAHLGLSAHSSKLPPTSHSIPTTSSAAAAGI